MVQQYRPIFKYYEFTDGKKVVVERDPQDGSEWPFHDLIYAEYNEVTQMWDLYRFVKEPLGISAPDKKSMIDEANCQLVTMKDPTQSPTVPPHTHAIDDITGLRSELDSKLSAAQAEPQPDSTAEDLATLVQDFNALLGKLRSAGIMK